MERKGDLPSLFSSDSQSEPELDQVLHFSDFEHVSFGDTTGYNSDEDLSFTIDEIVIRDHCVWFEIMTMIQNIHKFIRHERIEGCCDECGYRMYYMRSGYCELNEHLREAYHLAHEHYMKVNGAYEQYPEDIFNHNLRFRLAIVDDMIRLYVVVFRCPNCERNGFMSAEMLVQRVRNHLRRNFLNW